MTHDDCWIAKYKDMMDFMEKDIGIYLVIE